MVPKGWSIESLGNVTEKVGSGVTPRGGSNSYKLSGIPLIRSQNVLWGKLDLSDVAYIDELQHNKMKGSFVYKNDVLLNITGASIGRVAVSDIDEANVNQHVCIIRSEELNSEYLKSFLLSFQGQKQIEQCQAGGNRQGLNFEQIKSFKLPVPPFPEQQKIAKILSTWDKAISTTERLIDNSSQQKKALMQQLLTGKKRLLDDEGKRFKGEWETQSIESLTNRVGDGIHSTPKYTDKSSIRFVNGNNLNNGSIVFSDLTKFVDEEDAKNHHRNLSSRTILMSINGTIGNLAIYNDENIVLGKSACYINVKEEVDVLFIFYKLASSEVQSHFISRLTGSTIKNLSLTTVKSTQVALPSIPEQQKIAAVLTNADQEIELLEQQLANLQQEKKALMQVLLTGKKRVKLND